MCNNGRKFKPLACGFHSHTFFSLDGASSESSKIIRAAALGRIADCVTDHGVMSALATHYIASEKLYKDKKIPNKIKSIHGIEAYIVDPDRPPKVYKNGKVEPQYAHITIHFKTEAAYQYFCELTPKMESRAIIKFGESKPLLLLEELEPICGHITLGSGCLMGLVQKNVLVGRSDLARKNYIMLRELAGKGNFFVEVFPHIIDREWKRPVFNSDNTILVPGRFEPITPASIRRDPNAIDPEPCAPGGIIDIQKEPNLFVLALAKEFGDPVVISLDDHFSEEDDKLVQDVRLGNGKESWKFYSNHYSYSTEHCAEVLQKQLGVSGRDIEEWIDNSYMFVDLFKDYKMTTAKDRWLLPTTDMIYGRSDSSRVILDDLIRAHGKMPPETDPQYNVYKERLDYEISVLRDNGIFDFLPYFFVIEDAASYAKKNGILYNTRGSAGGSLLLYLLGVSITDPIKYGLPFERFLSLGRIRSGSLPDIDTDWEDRDIIIEYIFSKYKDKTALIATDLMLRLKSSIKDVERATLGRVRDETEELIKLVPPAPQGQNDYDYVFGYVDSSGTRHPGLLEEDNHVINRLKKYIQDNPEIWKSVLRCIGTVKTRGVHAGGIILAPDSISKFFPVINTNKGWATAYNMKSLESLGGVKYDFLGVSTLKALSITMKSLEKEEGIKLEWGEFPHDENVYKEVIFKNKLAGIFQLNTKIVRPYVTKIMPKNTKEIATLTALIRPGALDAPSPDPKDAGTKLTAAQYYVECAQGRRQPYFVHDDLKPILGYTNGIIVFQEQVLEIFRELAGYTYEAAEDVRRAIGKKIESELLKHGGILRERLLARGWTESQAKTLFDSVLASSRYSFNLSHAASYGIVAYNGCYLKYHYPLHFWKGELTIHTDDHDYLREIMAECGHLILAADATRGSVNEWVIDKERGGLIPPLTLIKGCGPAAAKKLKILLSKDDLSLLSTVQEKDLEGDGDEKRQ